MGKIKFRVWDKLNKKMYYPDRVMGEHEKSYFIEDDGSFLTIDGDGLTNYSSHYEYMQQIRVYQENMYVGDIIEFWVDGYLEIGGCSFDTKEPEKRRGVLIYSTDYYAYGIDFRDGCFMYLSTIKCDEIEEFCIIGNIYEDPQQLESKGG